MVALNSPPLMRVSTAELWTAFNVAYSKDVVHSGRGADRFANENQVAQADSRVVGQLHGLCGHVFYGQLTGLHFQGLRVVQYEMNSVEAGEVASRLDSLHEANAA